MIKIKLLNDIIAGEAVAYEKGDIVDVIKDKDVFKTVTGIFIFEEGCVIINI